MRCLLDTHVLLWAASAPARISAPVRKLLQVELGGPSFSNVVGGLAEVVTAGRKKLLERKLQVGTWFNEHGKKVLLPLMRYDTGCSELAVSVTFSTPDQKKTTRKATVPFACGQ